MIASMGGAASLLGAAPLAANAFVLESVYPTIRQAVRDRLDTWFGPFGAVARLFTSAVIDVVGSQTGVTESELEPITRIGRPRAAAPARGNQRSLHAVGGSQSLYAAAPSPKFGPWWARAGPLRFQPD